MEVKAEAGGVTSNRGNGRAEVLGWAKRGANWSDSNEHHP